MRIDRTTKWGGRSGGTRRSTTSERPDWTPSSTFTLVSSPFGYSNTELSTSGADVDRPQLMTRDQRVQVSPAWARLLGIQRAGSSTPTIPEPSTEATNARKRRQAAPDAPASDGGPRTRIDEGPYQGAEIDWIPRRRRRSADLPRGFAGEIGLGPCSEPHSVPDTLAVGDCPRTGQTASSRSKNSR